MEIIILIVAIIFLIVNDSKKSNNSRKIIRYDTQTGQPIYDEKYIRVGYDPSNGRPIYANEHKIIGYDTQTGKPIYDKKSKVIGYDIKTGYPIFEGEEELLSKYEPVKKQNNNQEDKTRLSNTILMITGSVLVLIASIIFLASSWDSISNIFKTIILIGVQMTFLLFSKICKNNLNIPKTSQIFNYIVFAFIPIILLSFSCFNLVGDYFSLNGEGWQLFFGGTFIVTDIFYKLFAKLKNDIVLKRMSLITEIFAIIFISDIFIYDFAIALLLLIIHNIIIYILLQGNFLDKVAYQKTNNITSYILIALTAINVLTKTSIINNLSMLIYTIFYFYRYTEAKESKEKMPLLFIFFFCYASALRIVEMIDFSSYFISLLSLIPIVLLTKSMNNENFKSVTRKIVLAISLITIFIALLNFNETMFYLLTFVSSLLLYIVMFNISKKSIYKILSYLSFASIFINICYITNLNDLSKYILLIMAILIYALEILFDKLKDKSSNYLILGLLCIESLVLTDTYSVILPVIMMILYTKLEKIDDTIIIIPMLCSLSLFNLDTNNLVSIIGYSLVSIYTCMSFIKRKINVYSIMSLITLTILALSFEISGIIYWVLLLIWGISHIIVNDKENNNFYKFITVSGALGLYLNILFDVFSVYYISIYLLGIYLALIVLTKNVFKNSIDYIEVFEILGYVLISLIGLVFINDIADAIIMIIITLILCIMNFSKKWNCYFYCSLITMIVFIISLALRFWEVIPWYIYILFIGIALIIYAIYDEKKKTKKQKEEENHKNN